MTTTILGLIAGSGQFPLWVAKAAKAQGYTVHAVGLTSWADVQLEQAVDSCVWLRLGELRKLIETLHTQQITTATVAGKVTKEALLHGLAGLDSEALRLLATIGGDLRVNRLLGAVAERLASEGITLVDATQFLHGWLPAQGTLTTREPTSAEWDDIWLGQSVAKALASFDIGQTVVLKRGVVLAVEASEATDEAIRRGGDYSDGGLVVVKMARPQQDMRFDVPVVGPETLQALLSARATCLAVEAKKTLLLERETLMTQANQAHLAIVAL